MILYKEEEPKVPKFDFVDTSVSKIINKYPPSTPFKQFTTKEIQAEIDDLKLQIHTLKINLAELKLIHLNSKQNLL